MHNHTVIPILSHGVNLNKAPFDVSPALPLGLRLLSDGTIEGRALRPAPMRVYQVSVTVIDEGKTCV